MQTEIQVKFKEIDNGLSILKKHFNWEQSLNRTKELDVLIETENFWRDSSKAQVIMREKKQIEKNLDRIKFIEIEKNNLYELIDLAEEENDKELIDETISQIDSLVKKCDKLQLESLLSGEADKNNCFIEIHAGAGGTEAQDWALMLQRMYSRWSEKRGFKISTKHAQTFMCKIAPRTISAASATNTYVQKLMSMRKDSATC